MCGYFVFTGLSIDMLRERYGAAIPGDEAGLDSIKAAGFYPSRGNTTTRVPVIFEEEGRRRLMFLRWDLIPSWWSKPASEKKFATYNARAASIEEKATFRGAWRACRRCIIPATGFFEWPSKTLMARDAPRVEHRIRVMGSPIFSLAGLWDECEKGPLKGLRSCTIITTAANSLMASIPHPRMPVILPLEDEAAWLSTDTPAGEAHKLLRRFPAERMEIVSGA